MFEANRGFWNTTLALLIHLIPTGILLVILALSWRWEWVGGFLFAALRILSCGLLGTVPLVSLRDLSGSLFLLGGLFLLSWKRRKALQAAT